jgi:hypothetical protein
MARKIARSSSLLTVVLLIISGLYAQQVPRPLNNDDVITMVKSGLPESVVVKDIQTRPGKYNTSPAELVRLHKAGVTENELNAIMGSQSSPSAKGPAASASKSATVAPPPPEPPVSKNRMPKLYLSEGSALKELPLEKTQLAETKTKPSSLKNLASDSVVTQAMQAGVNTAAWDTAAHMNSPIGGQTVQEAGSIFSGVLGHRTPTVTYVWGVSGPASTNVLQTTKPTFTLDFSRTIGINPDEYEPALVKLTPAQNTCRIAGATQGKEDVRSTPAADWQMYSHFLEERVAATPQKLWPGKYRISANSELFPGEYGVVLRPVSKAKNFSGGDVARAQGDGLMFDAIWTFQIAENAQ